MKLHRELGIGQKAAWFMLARLRKAYEIEVGPFAGPVEVDETYIGGKERNKRNSKKLNAGRVTVGKTAIVGAKDRNSNHIAAKVVHSTDKPTLQGFVAKHANQGATVYTDEATATRACRSFIGRSNHSVGQYVNDMAHTNGVESFWAMLKRGFHGTYHRISPKHLDRYVAEFAGRHNVRKLDTVRQMSIVAPASLMADRDTGIAAPDNRPSMPRISKLAESSFDPSLIRRAIFQA